MRKLDLILENIRDEYMINVLEEGTVTELETLKTKKFLNENLNRIRGMLVEEGALDGVKNHLANNWGKYLAGAGTAAGAYGLANSELGDNLANVATAEGPVGPKLDAAGQLVGDAAKETFAAGKETAGELADQAQQAGTELYNKAGELVDAAGNKLSAVGDTISNAAGDAKDAIVNAYYQQTGADPLEVLARSNAAR